MKMRKSGKQWPTTSGTNGRRSVTTTISQRLGDSDRHKSPDPNGSGLFYFSNQDGSDPPPTIVYSVPRTFVKEFCNIFYFYFSLFFLTNSPHIGYHGPMTSKPCTITVAHCKRCGSTHPEDVDMFANDGYSLCCNETILTEFDRCNRNHLNDNN